MSDLISRSALIEDIKECYTEEFLAEYGFDKLVEAQQTVEEKPVEWIPCSERLPENIRTVVLSIDEITFPTFGWYSQLEKRWTLTERDYIGIEDFTVSAWMPLPTPYKE